MDIRIEGLRPISLLSSLVVSLHVQLSFFMVTTHTSLSCMPISSCVEKICLAKTWTHYIADDDTLGI
jgi:hypothetical protein